MLSTAIWLQLKPETRAIIAKTFEISKSGNTEVVDNRVVSDGYTVNDLMGITIEKLKAFTNNNSNDFYFQFTKVVNFIEGKKPTIIENKEIVSEVKIETKKRYAKKTK